jgi:hypothetical protein
MATVREHHGNRSAGNFLLEFFGVDFPYVTSAGSPRARTQKEQQE